MGDRPPKGATWGSPLPQGDAGQFDQIPHAGGDEDGGLVAVAGLVVALHLLHHELRVPQQRVLREAVEVEPGGGNRGLRGVSGGSQPRNAPRVPIKTTLRLQYLVIDTRSGYTGCFFFPKTLI